LGVRYPSMRRTTGSIIAPTKGYTLVIP